MANDKARTPAELAAEQAKNARRKFLSQVENKWMVDAGDRMIGLVHPATREEAEQEMVRLGITGTLQERAVFENSRRFKEFLTLPEEKAKRKHEALSGLQKDAFGRPLESDIPRVQALLDAADNLTVDDV